MTRRLTPILLLLALTAMAAPVAGEQGRVVAEAAEYTDHARQQGLLDLAFLLNDGTTQTEPWIAVDAPRITASIYEETYTEVGVGAVPPPFPNAVSAFDSGVQTTSREFDSGSVRLTSSQPAFQVNVYPVGGPVPFQATSAAGRLQADDSARMSRGGFGDQAGGDVSTAPSDGSDFAFVERQGPHVLHRALDPQVELVARGDLVLEMFGVTLDVETASGPATLASGIWRERVDGAPAGSEQAVYEVRNVFVRLVLEGASLTVAVDGGQPHFVWASTTSQLQGEGPITLSHTFGRVHYGDDEVADLQDDRYVLPAGNLLSIVPQADGLAVDVSESDVGPRGTIADVPAPMSAALVGTGAVLALAAAVGVGLLRRFLRRPQLAEVEAAIEHGQYRKAARLAGRILARSPGDENAVLARGIALTKAGEHERAVRELVHHLSHSPASDGSLHYVLGLAQVDLGRKEEGHAALREAVRLTPALQTEVASRLGKAFSLPSTITKETNGYA